jgi:hypothetical protein
MITTALAHQQDIVPTSRRHERVPQLEQGPQGCLPMGAAEPGGHVTGHAHRLQSRCSPAQFSSMQVSAQLLPGELMSLASSAAKRRRPSRCVCLGICEQRGIHTYLERCYHPLAVGLLG